MAASECLYYSVLEWFAFGDVAGCALCGSAAMGSASICSQSSVSICRGILWVEPVELLRVAAFKCLCYSVFCWSMCQDMTMCCLVGVCSHVSQYPGQVSEYAQAIFNGLYLAM